MLTTKFHNLQHIRFAQLNLQNAISGILSSRNYHIAIGNNYESKFNNKANSYQRFAALTGVSCIRYASNEPIKTIVNLNEIPNAPSIPTSTTDITNEILTASGEPTFASIGLGGWSPVGMVQNCMEYLHIGLDLPWWGAIAIGTIVVRTLIFPLVIMSQRNSAKMNNNLPQLQVLQMKMTEARQSGNAIETARYSQEMMLFMKEKEMNPFKNMIVPLAQAPLFISFFMGLRAMANTPVDSMREGGLFWFTDLTIADPYFLLPIITSATLYLTIEIGTDSARLTAQNMQLMKYFLRVLPIAIFPFTMNFPGAILCYWACSNFISLGQVSILRIPAVRDYFKIEKMIVHKPENLPQKKKGFVEGMKESWSNMKITKELEERQRLDEIRFAKAGKGPLVKTYKYDPTKPRNTAPMAAKKQ